MTIPQTRRFPLPALVLGLLILAGCAVFGAGKYMERAQLKQLDKLLANLPEEYGFSVGAVDGSLFGRTLTLKRVSFSFFSEDRERITVTIGAVSGGGLNLAAPFMSGTATLADRLTLTDVTIDDAESTFTAGRFTLSGIRADVLTIRDFLKKRSDHTDSDEGMSKAAMWKQSGLDTLGIAGVEGTDLRLSSEGTEGEAPSVTIGSFRIADYSVLSTGPMSVKDIAVSFDGNQVASLGEAGLGRLVLPDPDDFKIFDRLDKFSFLTKTALKRDIHLDNLFIRNLTVSPTMPDGSVGKVTLAQAGISLGYAGDRAFFSMGTDALTVEKKLLALSEDALNEHSVQTREILRYLPETIVYTAQLATDISAGERGNAILAIKPIMVRVDDFGSVEIRLDMEYADMSLNAAKIKAIEVTASDTGASELIFSLLGSEDGQNAEQARNQSIFSLMTASSVAQGSLKELAENLRTFMEKPGATFAAKIILPEPLDIDTLAMQLMMDPDSLGLTSSVSRGGSGDGKP